MSKDAMKRAPTGGTCKLCLQAGAEIRKSHYLPAPVYKLLRDSGRQNPNPVVITRTGAYQSSKQEWRHLLCSACEQRLHENGEDWVLRHCLQPNGAFKIGTLLAARTPDAWTPGRPTKVYYAANMPEININALAYFAMSMFWRGSIYPWNDDGSVPVEFGPFQESIREYLLGEVAFPNTCSLLIAVRETGNWNRTTYLPVGWRDGKAHFFRFPIPGFGFSLAVSRNLPKIYRDNCAVNNNLHPIVVSEEVEAGVLQTFGTLLANTAYRNSCL